MKHCASCDQDLEDSLFNQRQIKCKECVKIYKQKHYLENKKLYVAKMKLYRENNKEVISAKKKEYRENNKEIIAAHKKKYAINNREKENKRKLAWANKKYLSIKGQNAIKKIYQNIMIELINQTNVKICTNCKKEKKLTNFKHKQIEKETSKCLECRDKINNNITTLSYREKQKKYYKEVLVSYSDDYKKGKECVDCGEDNWLVLEYDHINRNEKSCLVLHCGTLDKMIREIDKCELRCTFCHQLKTMKERGKGKKTGALKIKTDYTNQEKLKIEKCEKCDRKVEDNTLSAFDFDHLDRETKIECISKIVIDHKYTLEELKIEISKCRLLCKNCHKLHTLKQLHNKSN